MGRQESHHKDPEWIVAHRSEIDAVEAPRFSRGYWSSTLEFLKELAPEQAVKLLFHGGVPYAVESSIYKAAMRKRMQVSVYVRRTAVYICNNSSERKAKHPIFINRCCPVCSQLIHRKPGSGKQVVCAGTRKKKSECQKVLRYSREHGISIPEAKQRREDLRRKREARNGTR